MFYSLWQSIILPLFSPESSYAIQLKAEIEKGVDTVWKMFLSSQLAWHYTNSGNEEIREFYGKASIYIS